ncbi:hypothetical protein WMY93_029256 [Mugilogobius chulae]|uniref:Dehydrogenase/reductase SDR family member 11 n=1 Tax=Mugilogobius chulae TaxID=88201 RepID=A0AAW0N0Y4_9GOBI
MERWRGRVALVTGASVGIGAEIAKALVLHGMKVVGCARDVDKIKKLSEECRAAGHSGVLVPYKCDLTNEEEILSMFAYIKVQHQGVDVCINNAGLAHSDTLLNGKTSAWRNMLDVNVIALSVCTREAYQSMKERNVDNGHIININSVQRVVSYAETHFYTATKFAVTALTEALRQELREVKTHIRATSISPGVVNTEFALRQFAQTEFVSVIAETFKNLTSLEAVDVAQAVIYALSAPPHVEVGDVQIQPVENWGE